LLSTNSNLKRRHLNSFQRISLALKAKPILEELAKRNQKAGIKIDIGTSVRNQTQVVGGRVDFVYILIRSFTPSSNVTSNSLPAC
jgi:hypothetical protein